MRIIIGNLYYQTIEGSSVQITRSATDPVPTCTLNLRDINSTLKPQEMQEIVVIDDQVIPYPTVNMPANPSLNPYTTSWFLTNSVTGITPSQAVGGGVTFTFSNAANNATQELYQYLSTGSIAPGQTYTVSGYVQGSSPVNIGFYLVAACQDAAKNVLSTFQSPTFTVLSSSNRYSLTFTAPANSSIGFLGFHVIALSATNSGSVTVTQIQMEPNWIPTLSYPTPWCGPSQTNCVQLPLGQWIRQYRKFAGFITQVTAQDYHGNVRTLVVNASGYAWLAGTILVNDSFSSKTDAQIITSLCNKYLTHQTDPYTAAINMVNTSTYVVTGVTVTNLQSNWDDLRALFDGLTGLSGFPWTIDYYWNFVYTPAGYITMPFTLICDDSSNPNFTTTYPAYNFSADSDFTQPGSTILVIGSGSNVAEVIDPEQTAQIGIISGYSLPIGSSWMRKINDSTLTSTTDCTTRGLAEMLQYDDVRNIYHLSTNVELISGQGVPVTSATEGLSASVQYIQQVRANWLGTNEKLIDLWEYAADLGAANRAATNMISRIFRQTQKNSSAPAIVTTSLALFESIGVTDTTGTGTTVSNYAQTILADTPIAYYRLAEITGTIADDISGNAYQGTLHGGITQGVATLLTDPADTSDLSMTFNGTTGYISLPTTFVPTGAHAWSIECWTRIASIPANGSHVVLGMGGTATHAWALITMAVTAGVPVFTLATNGGDISSGTISVATTYHVVGTYDGTSTRLYVNGSLVAGPSAFALTLAQTWAAIGAYQPGGPNSFSNATIDECAYYTYALSSTQVSAHYAAGI